MPRDLVMIALGSVALSLVCLGIGAAAGARPVPAHPRTLDASLNGHRCCRIIAFNKPFILEA